MSGTGNVPADLRCSKDHEWVKVEGDKVRIGVTDFAQEQLSDVVYVELPKVGTHLKQFDKFGIVESVKSVSELYAPVGGEVLQVNTDLPKTPEIVNSDPYGKGWMIVIKPTDLKADQAKLLTAEQYQQHIAAGH